MKKLILSINEEEALNYLICEELGIQTMTLSEIMLLKNDNEVIKK